MTTPDTRPTTESDGLDLGLTAAEYGSIVELLGRTPNYTELGVYSVMWSEHCSYKNSILQLKTLPRSGERLLVEAGEENAGLVDIGDGYGVAFKIESHNHPSAVEPYQGAATGVGGILRDIFTMGARPVAALDSLRFGHLDDDRTKYLFEGVVRGIGDYGNSFGVPTVGGEVYFDDSYRDNPLVNAMAVGVVQTDRTVSATSGRPGLVVMILGASTGRDGIHGASLLASREFDELTEDMRPTVQVGDPFSEKMLLEATLDLIRSGVVVGMQDMGAAGISCSTAEMSEKGGTGMRIDLDLVPLREADMSAYEIMLSESQERMLLVLEEHDVERASEICERWDVPITRIGETTDTGRIELSHRGESVASIPAESLVLGGGAPVYVREQAEPAYFAEKRSVDARALIGEIEPGNALERLMGSPNIASKSWVYRQYDSTVRSNTIDPFTSDAAVIRLKEVEPKGLAAATDCNSRYVYLDPYNGAAIAVAESARNVVCSGGEPVAITNCLNFGNPYNPGVYWQFAEAIRGMRDACTTFNTPVTGGNVSFHNESQTSAINPTPTIGMLGVIDDIAHVTPSGFRSEGDAIFLVGAEADGTFGGSELLQLVSGEVTGVSPTIDLDFEGRLQSSLLRAIRTGAVRSAHDAAEGGVAVALTEAAILSSDGDLGFRVDLGGDDPISSLFCETQSRVVISVASSDVEAVGRIFEENDVPCRRIGSVERGVIAFSTAGIERPLEPIASIWRNRIESIMTENEAVVGR